MRSFHNGLQVIDALIDLANANGDHRFVIELPTVHQTIGRGQVADRPEAAFARTISPSWDYALALYEQGEFSQADSEFRSVLELVGQSCLSDFHHSVLLTTLSGVSMSVL